MSKMQELSTVATAIKEAEMRTYMECSYTELERLQLTASFSGDYDFYTEVIQRKKERGDSV